MLATLPPCAERQAQGARRAKRTAHALIGDVPTIAEQGVPASSRAPGKACWCQRHAAAIVAQLNAELIRVIRAPDVRAALAGRAPRS
jgi:tripartite-type tricarboxylate transporter receptor subunit TctC